MQHQIKSLELRKLAHLPAHHIITCFINFYTCKDGDSLDCSHSSTSYSMLLGTQIPRSCIGHCKYGEQSAWTFCIFEDYEVLLSLLFFRLMSLIQQFIQSFPGIWDLLLLWSYSVLLFNFMTVCANPGFMLESRSQIHFIAEALPLSYKAEGYFQVPFLLV